MEIHTPLIVTEMSEDEKILVEDQLDIILESTYFQSAKQMQRFLKYIVKKTLAGEAKFLKQYTIGVEALDLSDDFDSDSNPSVRIMGGRVRGRLKEFYESTINNKIIINIPKGTYAPEFNYYENKGTEFLADDNSEKEAIISAGPSLALVSFTDKSQNQTSNRLLVQTTDAIAKEFSRFLLFRFSVFNPCNDKSESHGLKKAFDTDFVLALFVQQLSNNQYELICRFSSTNTQQILWSESYELDHRDSVINQDDAIRKIIAGVVDIHHGRMQLYWARSLLEGNEPIPNNFQVMAYYRQYYDKFNRQTFAKAVSVCEKIIKSNPYDLISNLVYSDLCRRDYVYAYDLMDKSLDRGIKHAENLTHLRPDSSEAHFVLGQLLFSKEEWDSSFEELKTATELSKYNNSVKYASGYYYCLMDRWDEGLTLVKDAVTVSSSIPPWFHMAISLHFHTLGKYKEALIEAKKIVSPSLTHGPLARCISYAQLNEITKAKNEYFELVKIIPEIENNGEEIIFRLLGNKKFAFEIWEIIQRVVKA